MQQGVDHNSANDLSALLMAAGLTAREKLGELSREEASLLNSWLQQDARHMYWWEELTDAGRVSDLMAQYRALEPVAVEELEKFRQAHLLTARPPAVIPVDRNRTGRSWRLAAASIVFLVGIAAYFWIARKNISLPGTAVAKAVDRAPGKFGAMLTLGDGSLVSLDTLTNATVALQGGVIASVKDGALIYEGSGEKTVHNTMTTPNGRQFLLILQDGSRVWLNAASSIRYPTVFSGNERRVDITGEAYFEVAKNSKMPFRVYVNSTVEVEVLGTSFNINAYENEEDIRTTLLEGSVRIVADARKSASGQSPIILIPGQQARTGSGRSTVVNRADIGKTVAWKNGYFDFENASLDEVMRQLERWYDIEVVYENGVPDFTFFGKISRDTKLSGLIKGLEASKVHFRMEGERRLVVLP